MNFENFSKAVAVQYNKLISMGELFYVEVERDELFGIYLQSFPAGTNNIYKTRLEYDCNCCKQFIRNTGHVVAIKDGVVHSLWDIDLAAIEPNFQVVAKTRIQNQRIREILDQKKDSELLNKSVEELQAMLKD